MRDHHTLTSCRPRTSDGCEACIFGHAPTKAATRPATAPTPSPIGSATGRSANTDINAAPRIAIGTATSIPVTHWTVAVDLETATVRRRTITADQNRPPPSQSRPRSHTADRTAPASMSPGRNRGLLGDTDRIARSHQPGEVIALADNVQIDVLAQVKADVLVGSAEAGTVQIENDQCRALAAHRLEQPHPRGVGARRYHRDRASWQTADPVPRQRLGKGRAAVGLADREVVEDQTVLPHRAVRFQHGAARIVGDQAHLAAPAVHLRRERRRETHTVLQRRLLVLTEVDRAVEVEQDPEVGRQRLLESLG